MSIMRIRSEGRPIIANVERLHRLMDQAGLAAVVVRGGHNVTYLSGVSFHGTLARHLDLAASPRGAVVVWPRNGEPVFVLELTATGPARRDSWIERFEVFSGYSEPVFTRVGSVLAALGLAQARVGFDKDYVGAGFWEGLGRQIPGMVMLDCSDLMDDVRRIKTPVEIERLRAGAKLLDAAFSEVLPTIRPNDVQFGDRLRRSPRADRFPCFYRTNGESLWKTLRRARATVHLPREQLRK